eukprot:3478389-Amphidinium_carterae.1
MIEFYGHDRQQIPENPHTIWNKLQYTIFYCLTLKKQNTAKKDYRGNGQLSTTPQFFCTTLLTTSRVTAGTFKVETVYRNKQDEQELCLLHAYKNLF